MTLEILTSRLRLIPFTAETVAASRHDRAAFARLIAGEVPNEWPPEMMADVEEMMGSKLKADPAAVGWWGWYIIAKPGVARAEAVLAGSVGCSKWGPFGNPHFGYGMLPEFYRRGMASEAALALMDWVIKQPGIAQIEATTFERHEASLKILGKCGFTCVGVSPDDATAPESDRQGRGRLLQFVRKPADSGRG